jgi:hypothetical protein
VVRPRLRPFDLRYGTVPFLASRRDLDDIPFLNGKWSLRMMTCLAPTQNAMWLSTTLKTVILAKNHPQNDIQTTVSGPADP